MKPSICNRLLVLGLLALLAGCQNQSPNTMMPDNDAVPPDGPTRQYARFIELQSAAAARRDGMLYDYHFSNASLNSLGQQKLALMSRIGDGGFPVIVYLVLPQEQLTLQRAQSVLHFLEDQGLQESQIAICLGDNPNATFSAAAGIDALNKQESASVASDAYNAAPGAGNSASTAQTAPDAGSTSPSH
jgi:hypothetical protein